MFIIHFIDFLHVFDLIWEYLDHCFSPHTVNNDVEIASRYQFQAILPEFFGATYRFEDDRDKDVFRVQLNAVERFRNPHKTNPTNLNCSSCHFADAAMTYAGRRFEEFKKFKSTDSYVNKFKNRFNLTNNTIAPKSSRIVRAFGYFESFPALNQRVIHDSAESAIWMDK